LSFSQNPSKRFSFTWLSLTHSTNWNGPVPTGFRAKSSLNFSTAVFDTIMPARSVNTLRNGVNGELSEISTVYGSTTFTSLTGAISLRRGEASAGSRMRSKFHFTISALKSEPSWNFTPRRSLKTYVRPPSLTSQEVASCGTIPNFASMSTSLP
jgi:hypothetical protein